MSAENERPTKQEAQRLYDQYVKPLELKHKGEYAAVSPEGQMIIAATLLEAVEKASSTLGPSNFVFKVGQKVVGKWR